LIWRLALVLKKIKSPFVPVRYLPEQKRDCSIDVLAIEYRKSQSGTHQTGTIKASFVVPPIWYVLLYFQAVETN
jgi:hypothetical protein